MKFLLALAFAVVACAADSVLPKTDLESMDPLKFLMESEDDIELAQDADDSDVEISPHNIILRWQLTRFIRKIQKKMPCGFPEYGVPPLEPARFNDVHFEWENGVFETVNDFPRFRIDGLSDFIIKRFKVNLILRRLKFGIDFRNITVSSPEYSTKTLVDALETMGLFIKIEANDEFSFGLKNLSIKGVAHFDFPLFIGSNKLISLKTKIGIEKCNIQMGGVLGNGRLNNVFNTLIETFIEDKVAEMTDEISDWIENAVKPRVNKLNGTDFWNIVVFILNAVDGEKEDDPIVVECIPPPDPWA